MAQRVSADVTKTLHSALDKTPWGHVVVEKVDNTSNSVPAWFRNLNVALGNSPTYAWNKVSGVGIDKSACIIEPAIEFLQTHPGATQDDFKTFLVDNMPCFGKAESYPTGATPTIETSAKESKPRKSKSGKVEIVHIVTPSEILANTTGMLVTLTKERARLQLKRNMLKCEIEKLHKEHAYDLEAETIREYERVGKEIGEHVAEIRPLQKQQAKAKEEVASMDEEAKEMRRRELRLRLAAEQAELDALN